MSSLGLKESYVGSQAQALRGILAISHPIRQGAVQDWDDLEVITLSSVRSLTGLTAGHLVPHLPVRAVHRAGVPAADCDPGPSRQPAGRGQDGGDPGGEAACPCHVHRQQVRHVVIRRREHDGDLRGQRPRHNLPRPQLPGQRSPGNKRRKVGESKDLYDSISLNQSTDDDW